MSDTTQIHVQINIRHSLPLTSEVGPPTRQPAQAPMIMREVAREASAVTTRRRGKYNDEYWDD